MRCRECGIGRDLPAERGDVEELKSLEERRAGEKAELDEVRRRSKAMSDELSSLKERRATKTAEFSKYQRLNLLT